MKIGLWIIIIHIHKGGSLGGRLSLDSIWVQYGAAITFKVEKLQI